MARSNPYDRHSDFYLIDLWQARDGLSASDLQALQEEMSHRGLDPEAKPGAVDPYRGGPEEAGTHPCPLCGSRMRDGELTVHRQPGMWLHNEGYATHLYFRHGRDETIVFEHKESRPGWMCDDCGTVIVRRK